MPIVHIMSGLPGSGKSTEATRICKENTNTYRISRDDIRLMLGDYTMAPIVEAVVTSVCDKALESMLYRDMNVVIDNINGKPQYIEKQVRALAHRFDMDVECVRVPVLCTVEEAVERDRLRGLVGGRTVGETVIRLQAAKHPHLVKVEQP
jgi:predicted kinase